jgi:hypothetical protein
MKTDKLWRWIWRPPGEAFDALTAALRAHWLAARGNARGLFSAPPGSWLHPRKVRVRAHHLTSGGRLIR